MRRSRRSPRPSRSSRSSRAALGALLLASVAACAAAQPPAGATPAPSAGHAAAPTAPSSADAGESSTAAEDAMPPTLSRPALPLCGCALCAPVISDDACTQDADCAPATPCHAEACVAKAKAKASTPRTSCTMILRCNSVDANTCGCLEGRCALFPPKR